MNTKYKTNNSIKETISMKNILSVLKAVANKIKGTIQAALREYDLDLYEFEQLDAKRSYRPIRNPWEQL